MSEVTPRPSGGLDKTDNKKPRLEIDPEVSESPDPETSSQRSSPQISAIDRDPEKSSAIEKGVFFNDSPSDTVIEERPSPPQDPNIVDWDGPNDPYKAINWPEKRKWANVAIISSITFLTPLASSMFAPGVPEVMTEFKSTNVELASFVVSVYILGMSIVTFAIRWLINLGYAIGPLIIGPLSELYGRLPIYHTCNVLFVIFTIACAVSTNLNMLVVFRFFEGCSGSAPLTIGGGSLADMIIQERRGGAMAIWALGPLMGPVVGPVAGGFLSQAAGWRWVFWVLAIAVSIPHVVENFTTKIDVEAGVITGVAFIFMRETYPPTLLQRKVNRLKKETRNQDLRSAMNTGRNPKQLFLFAITRPTKMLFLSPIVFSLSLYMAVVYGYLYLLFTTITEVFEGQYGFSQGTVGLTFLGIGVGSLLGLLIFGIASDRILKHMAQKGEMKPEYRLPPLVPAGFLIPLGLFWYGWTADKKLHWILPIIGTMFVGLGLLATFVSMPSPVGKGLILTFEVDADQHVPCRRFHHSRS